MEFYFNFSDYTMELLIIYVVAPLVIGYVSRKR